MRSSLARLALLSLAVLAAWSCLVALVRNDPPAVKEAVIGLSRALCGGLLLAASALRFAAWRITGNTRGAWSAIALAVAGFAFPVVGMIDYLPTAAGADSTPIARALVEFSLIGFGAAALAAPAVVSRIRPLRIVTPFLVGCLAVTVLITVRGPGTSADALLGTVSTVVQWIIAALWSALAAAYLLLGWWRGNRIEQWVGYALAVLAVVSLTRAALGNWQFSRMAAPAGAQLVVASLVVGVSALRLWQLHSVGGAKLLSLSGALRGAQADLTAVERDQAQRLHDARSAILGVAGAARWLGRPESVSGIDPDRLQGLVSAELKRVGTILDPDFRSSNRRFRPAEVLEPLIVAHRLAGTQIHSEIADAWAFGRPEATATAVANLLSNTRIHAPGARVWITVTAAKDLRIRVEDDGPGIGNGEHDLVLRPGVRGSAANGHGNGIGLSAAAQLMADQGGTLALGRRPGGGTSVVLTLQLAPARTDDSPLTIVTLPAASGLLTSWPASAAQEHSDWTTIPAQQDVRREPASR